jgi:hypothetical protein
VPRRQGGTFIPVHGGRGGSVEGATRRQGVGEGSGGALGRRCRSAAAWPRRERACDACACGRHRTGERRGLTGGPLLQSQAALKYGLNHFKNSNCFKNIQFFPNFGQSKFDLAELQKFRIKYGFEDLKETNNFLHRIFFRFRILFK